MPYTSNPHMGITRRKAIDDVLTKRKSRAEAARYYGVTKSTITKWLKRKPIHNRQYIETQSSRPHSCPWALGEEIVTKVVELRRETGRCAQILYAMLRNEGVQVSLSSIKRILKKNNLTRKKKQTKPPYAKIQRPKPEKPGSLVEMDTIHFIRSNGIRFYIYAVIDLYSRYGYAEYSKYLSAKRSFEVAIKARKYFGFTIGVLQTDNGGEFGEQLYFLLQRQGIKLRHTRPRRPNDNAHVERFIRTIQEEGFKWVLPNEKTIKRDLHKFINYYNNERFHLGINCNTPCSLVSKLLS